MTIRTGGARFPSTNYKTSKYCVAYLDILGGRNIICKDDTNEHLNKINMIFEDALHESKIFTQGKEYNIFVKIFSDNILLAIPTDDKNRKQNIEKIIVLINNIIQEVADYGYLMRGAITEGDFFHNDIIVYGKALVEAVEMEEKYAVYPRVIVKSELAKFLPQYFYPCADGWHILNNYIFNINFSLENFKQTFLQQLKHNKENRKVVQKIMWAITDFNNINKHMCGICATRPTITSAEIEKAIL